MPENPVSCVFIGIFAILALFCGFRLLKNVLSPIRSVEASVIHKQKVENISGYSGTGKHTKYAVTFSAGNNRFSFYVSEFSYRGYRIGEKGILKYKGDRLIEFT